MRFIRSMNARVDRLALGYAILSAAIILIILVTGWEVADWLSALGGLWVGLFLVWGAFHFFRLGESAAKFIYYWGLVVCWLIIAFGPVGLGRIYALPVSASISALPTPTKMAWGAAAGLMAGAASTAQVIARRLRNEDRRPQLLCKG